MKSNLLTKRLISFNNQGVYQLHYDLLLFKNMIKKKKIIPIFRKKKQQKNLINHQREIFIM